MPARPGVVEYAKTRGELGGLLHPVKDQRARDDRQRWSLGLTVGPPPLQECQYLNRLTQTHVVGQDATKAKSLKVVEPA